MNKLARIACGLLILSRHGSNPLIDVDDDQSLYVDGVSVDNLSTEERGVMASLGWSVDHDGLYKLPRREEVYMYVSQRHLSRVLCADSIMMREGEKEDYRELPDGMVLSVLHRVMRGEATVEFVGDSAFVTV